MDVASLDRPREASFLPQFARPPLDDKVPCEIEEQGKGQENKEPSPEDRGGVNLNCLPQDKEAHHRQCKQRNHRNQVAPDGV